MTNSSEMEDRAPLNLTRDVKLLKLAVAFIWFTTGILVLHPFYRTVGAQYLGQMHLPVWLMYVSCAFEVLLALYVIRFRAGFWVTALQLGSIAFFTVSLGWVEPALLAHPFGMLTKNLPPVFIILSLYRMDQGSTTNAPPIALLRVGMASIWIIEGLIPKILFQTRMEVAVVANSGLVPFDPAVFLALLGVAQVVSGVLALVLRGRFLHWLLMAQIAGLVILPTLVSWQMPWLWVHPFGPMTKNIPIIIGTYVVLKWSR